MRNTLTAAAVAILVATAALLTAANYTRSAVTDTGAQATMLFTGDLMLGRYVGAGLRDAGYGAAFTDVKSTLSGADLTVGNLEGPLVPTARVPLPPPSANQPLLTGDAAAAPALAASGFDLLSLANNHSMDAGTEGLQATRSALKQSGIEGLGFGPVVKQVHGIKIAFLAYTLIAPNVGKPESLQSYIDPKNPTSKARMLENIQAARGSADVVVVIMHWGDEYAAAPNATQKQLAKDISAAGADLIVGAHPHVVQGMELITGSGRSTLAAYSLGNALFDQVLRPETQQGFALSVVVDKAGVKQAKMIPLAISNTHGYYSMSLANDASATAVTKRAGASTSDALKWQILDRAGSTPSTVLAYRRPQLTASIEDLGMGNPANIELKNGTLSVSGGAARWQTPPDWRVTGYTVGDADGDGKPDLIYTVWKRRLVWTRPASGGMSVDMEGGPVLPHIYINGWRQGEMRPVWQGSPRPAPVVAVAVAPLDTAGKPLLASLDSSDPAKEQVPGTIHLWKWTGGFGYELVDTLPGLYSEMWSDGKALLYH